jgi:hypothetical protein
MLVGVQAARRAAADTKSASASMTQSKSRATKRSFISHVFKGRLGSRYGGCLLKRLNLMAL